MERDFKGIWIPAELWLDKNLSLQEKLFLSEIDSLDVSEQGCFASNEYFSEFFNLSKNRCSEIIKSLEKKKLISINYEYKKGKKCIDKRILKVFGKSTKGIRDIDRGVRNVDMRYSENLEDINTLCINTINNKSIVEIIDYFNQVCGTNYKPTTKKTQQLITARLGEGFVVDDFKIVIDKMHRKWTGTKWQEYLRPSTLFNADKFEGYLNAQVSPPKTVEGHKVASEDEDCPY